MLHTRNMNGVTIFIMISVCMGLAMGLSDAVLSNYFKEAYEVTPRERGFIEFPRELPGILSLFIIGAMASLKNVRTAIAAQLLAAIGIAVLGFWRPDFMAMCVFLFIYSLGAHMYMPLNDSIGLTIAKARGTGTGGMMGRFNSARMASSMLAGLLVFFGFRYNWFSFDTPVIIFIMSMLAFVFAAAFLAALRKAEPLVEADAPVNAKFVFRKEYMRYYIICGLFGGRKQIMIVYSPWVLIELLGFRADTMSILAVAGSLIGVFFLRLIGKWIDKYGVRKIMMVESCAFIAIYIAYGLLSRWLNLNADIRPAGILLFFVYLLNIADRMTGQFSMDRPIYMRAIALKPEDVTPSLSLGMSIDHVMAIAGAAVCGVIWQNFGPEYVFVLAGLMSLVNWVVARGIRIKGESGVTEAL